MSRALEMFVVEGITPAFRCTSRIMADPDFRAGNFDTKFMERFLTRVNGVPRRRKERAFTTSEGEIVTRETRTKLQFTVKSRWEGTALACPSGSRGSIAPDAVAKATFSGHRFIGLEPRPSAVFAVFRMCLRGEQPIRGEKTLNYV